MSLISIIVCTRNRADSLRHTLTALAKLQYPALISVEVIVVDNGSTDGTALLLAEVRVQFEETTFISLFEPHPGKSRALNRAIAVARGEILLFTDDDVRPPRDWIEGMVQPILKGEADAVAGGIRLAPHLKRPWLGREQRAWLASTEDLPRGIFHPLIGANMAVSKRVFETVPGFDPAVGPGATGHAEDTLFSAQIESAGLKIITRLEIEVEHHLEESRLLRSAFVRQAEKRGEFEAYIDYHWCRTKRRYQYLATAIAWVKLWWARIVHLPEWWRLPTMPAWELSLLESYHFRRRLLIENQHPRNYDDRGQRKQGFSTHTTSDC